MAQPVPSSSVKALELRNKAQRWGRELIKKFPVRDGDRPQILAILTEMWLFEQPTPNLEVSIMHGDGIRYTVTVCGYSPVFDSRRWVALFMHVTDRPELLRRVSGAMADLTTKEIQLILYVDSVDAPAGMVPVTRKPEITAAARVYAAQQAGQYLTQLQVNERDRKWVEAALVEAALFEQPAPDLEVSCDTVQDMYNVTIHGYQNFVDLVDWHNRFLSKNRDKLLSHVTHTWLQNVPDKGPGIVLQMEKSDFQKAMPAPEGKGRPVPAPGRRKRID